MDKIVIVCFSCLSCYILLIATIEYVAIFSSSAETVRKERQTGVEHVHGVNNSTFIDNKTIAIQNNSNENKISTTNADLDVLRRKLKKSIEKDVANEVITSLNYKKHY